MIIKSSTRRKDMKAFAIILLSALLGMKAMAQDGVVSITVSPASVPIGGTVTGTMTITLDSNMPSRQAISITSGNPEYPITSASLTSGNGTVEPWNYNDPTTAFTVTTSPFPIGTYVVTFTMEPTGTVPDPVGASIQGSFGGLLGQAPNVPLPVKLTAFSASKEGSFTQLKWTTTEENNSSHFEIEHSVDARNWVKIGVQNASKESTSLIDYQFIHQSPVNGMNYYRLKMVDLDETFAYSRISKTSFDGLVTEPAKLYPNPVAERLFVKSRENVETVSIYNSSGRVLLTGKSAELVNGLDVKSLPLGVYFVKILDKNGAFTTQKIAIAR